MQARQPIHLLLVDDSEANRMTLGALLEEAGYTVIEASSLAEARSLSGPRLDVSILDVHLGDGLGTQLIPELAEAHPGITQVVLSGNDPEPIEGAALVLAKDMDPNLMLAQLASALEGAR